MLIHLVCLNPVLAVMRAVNPMTGLTGVLFYDYRVGELWICKIGFMEWFT